MFIAIPYGLLHSQNFDECLRFACNQLYKEGVNNFIHYEAIRIVELFGPNRKMNVTIDYKIGGVLLTEQ